MSRQGEPRTGRPAHLVVGIHAVEEALRDRVPADELVVAEEQVGGHEALVAAARGRGVPVRRVPRAVLDDWSERTRHQGVGLAVPAYRYSTLDDLLGSTLLVALDGVTDPRNLGAIARSAAAFGAGGVVVPERRAAGVTPAAWKTSAGAVARIPVARVVNLPRALSRCKDSGMLVLGLSADADTDLWGLGDDMLLDPVCLVIGSEGRGIGQLVARTCDLRVSIPMTEGNESVNASVAAAVALAEVARRRRLAAVAG